MTMVAFISEKMRLTSTVMLLGILLITCVQSMVLYRWQHASEHAEGPSQSSTYIPTNREVPIIPWPFKILEKRSLSRYHFLTKSQRAIITLR